MREIIDAIIFVLLTFISNFIYLIIFSKVNKLKYSSNFKNISLVFLVTILSLIATCIFSIQIKVILVVLLIGLELKEIFKVNYRNALVNSIFIYILTASIEVILTNILLRFSFICNNNSANTVTYINIFLTLSISIIEYVLFLFPFFKKGLKKILDVFLNENSSENILYLIFVSVIILSIIHIRNFANNDSIKLILVLFAMFVFLCLAIIRLKFREAMLILSNNKLFEYNTKYGKFLEEYKVYKHNLNNKLIGIKSYGNKKANALIDALLEEENNFSFRNNELYNVPNGIKGLVAEKLFNKDYDVLIKNEIIGDPFSNLDSKSFNSISECLGIALDNAIEASEETENPIIIMDIKEDKENIYLKVGNNHCNSIDLTKIGEKYYSTKNRGSGLGLFSIMNNKIVKEKINIINDFYYIELQIKKAR